MDEKDLSIFREMLEKRKEEILNQIENQAKSFRYEEDVGDMLDHASASFYRDEYFQTRENATDMLYQINEALARIESGIYGICEDCGTEIPEQRLTIIPFATLCAECSKRREER